MKLLFVGEGPHDVGHADGRHHPAGGVVTELTRRALGTVDDASVARFWRQVPRFPRDRRQRGLAGKVMAAVLIARREGCAALVCVHDRDGDDSRREDLRRGSDAATLPTACGLAVESIEAWTLGDPDAIATTLSVDATEIRAVLRARDVERMKESSGKPERRPKTLLRRIFGLAERDDSTELREEIARNSDPRRLAEVCPLGFAPFLEELARIGQPPP